MHHQRTVSENSTKENTQEDVRTGVNSKVYSQNTWHTYANQRLQLAAVASVIAKGNASVDLSRITVRIAASGLGQQVQINKDNIRG